MVEVEDAVTVVTVDLVENEELSFLLVWKSWMVLMDNVVLFFVISVTVGDMDGVSVLQEHRVVKKFQIVMVDRL